MREEAVEPLLPRRAPAANAGGAAASVEKMRVHVAERARCTQTQPAMRSRRHARSAGSLLRPMVALGALSILVSLSASRAKLFGMMGLTLVFVFGQAFYLSRYMEADEEAK